MSDATTFLLTEDRIPTHWVNVLPDLPGEPLPPLNPQTGEPAGPEDLTPIFPMALIEQAVSSAPDVEIPEEVRDAYNLSRRPGRTSRTPPSPRPSPTRGPACASSRRRPAQASGAARWRSPAACSGWS